MFEYVGFTYIPFECPNSLVAIISDFILSLDVVDVAVVYSINSDGIKFSVRSEREDVDAGKLIYQALDGIGSGGGHAAMAGGFVTDLKIGYRFLRHYTVEAECQDIFDERYEMIQRWPMPGRRFGVTFRVESL